jgi:hypothetical protein
VTLDLRFVAQIQFRAHFGGASIVAEENDFHVRMKKLPALEGIALDDGGVSVKWPAVVKNVSIAMSYEFIAKTMLDLFQNKATKRVGTTMRV